MIPVNLFYSIKTSISMALQRKILFLAGGYIVLSSLAYFVLFAKDSFNGEFFLIGALLFLLIVYLAIAKPLVESLQKLSHTLIHHGLIGKIEKHDELEKLKLIIEHYSSNEKNAATLIHNIRNGKMDLNVKGDNELIRSLVDLRTHIATMLEKEKQRNWVSQGVANFGATLRKQTGDANSLYDHIICDIVRYLGINQGGLFLVNENKTKLELKACYAYDRKKFQEKEIEFGQGLVGQVYLEKETLLLKQIPQNYLNIRSGLGSAEPAFIVIVPFKLNDEVECIVELASFEPFEPYHIEFLEKLGESVAATISSIKINSHTKKLLYESQNAAEQLRAQEEELRQNMEELEATQEEMRRKETEMVRLMDKMADSEKALKENLEEIKTLQEQDEIKTQQMMNTIEAHRKMLVQIIDHIPQKIFLKDKDGKFLLTNSAVAKAHHKTVDELIGTSDFDHFAFEDATEYRKAELEIVKAGRPVYFPEEVFKDSNGEEKILQTTKMPFYISHLNQMGLLGIQTDVTEVKQMERALKQVHA
jgi:PAS domain S-box-containing protein